jgi:transglutaminase-like putative cysteine protease
MNILGEKKESREILLDFDHPEIKKTDQALVAGIRSSREKVKNIFYFVQDEIQFGFLPVWDAVKASETLKYKMVYCTTKATLFNALCQAADIPSKVHTWWIKVEILQGTFPSFAYKFLPKAGTHAWMEMELDGQWRPID